MTQIIGSSLILLAGWGAGETAAQMAARTREELQGLLDVLRFIRAQIDSFALPREEIFHRIECPRLAGTAFVESLRATRSLSEAAKTLLHLPSEALGLVCAFDRELGRGFLSEELRLCDYYTKELTALSDEVTARLPARTRVARTLSLSLSLMAVLLLL